MKQIDSEKLKQAAVSNPKVERVLRYLATRDRGRRITSFTRLRSLLEREGDTLPKQEFRTILEPFTDVGAGHIVERNNETYFQWEPTLDSVARDILGIAKPTYKTRWSGHRSAKIIATKVIPIIPKTIIIKYNGLTLEIEESELTSDTCQTIISVLKTMAQSR